MTVADVKPNIAARVRAHAEAWASRCVESGQSPSSELGDDDLAALSADEQSHLLRVGAVSITNDVLHSWRGGGDAADGESRRNPMHPAAGRNPTFWRGLGIVCAGADGALRPLVEFGRADLEHLADEAESLRAAWARRKSWAGHALRELDTRSKARVDELPAEVLAELDEQAAKAWGR